jgi:ATP-dependent DNA helicase DinG
MLEDQPSIAEVLDKFILFIRGADYMVGHNSIRFDCLFLKSAAIKYKKQLDLHTVRQLDTMLIYQYYYPGMKSFSLYSLCTCFSIVQNNAHRAMGDVISTEKLLNRILRARTSVYETLYLNTSMC